MALPISFEEVDEPISTDIKITSFMSFEEKQQQDPKYILFDDRMMEANINVFLHGDENLQKHEKLKLAEQLLSLHKRAVRRSYPSPDELPPGYVPYTKNTVHNGSLMRTASIVPKDYLIGREVIATLDKNQTEFNIVVGDAVDAKGVDLDQSRQPKFRAPTWTNEQTVAERMLFADANPLMPGPPDMEESLNAISQPLERRALRHYLVTHGLDPDGPALAKIAKLLENKNGPAMRNESVAAPAEARAEAKTFMQRVREFSQFIADTVTIMQPPEQLPEERPQIQEVPDITAAIPVDDLARRIKIYRDALVEQAAYDAIKEYAKSTRDLQLMNLAPFDSEVFDETRHMNFDPEMAEVRTMLQIERDEEQTLINETGGLGDKIEEKDDQRNEIDGLDENDVKEAVAAAAAVPESGGISAVLTDVADGMVVQPDADVADQNPQLAFPNDRIKEMYTYFIHKLFSLMEKSGIEFNKFKNELLALAIRKVESTESYGAAIYDTEEDRANKFADSMNQFINNRDRLYSRIDDAEKKRWEVLKDTFKKETHEVGYAILAQWIYNTAYGYISKTLAVNPAKLNLAQRNNFQIKGAPYVENGSTKEGMFAYLLNSSENLEKFFEEKMDVIGRNVLASYNEIIPHEKRKELHDLYKDILSKRLVCTPDIARDKTESLRVDYLCLPQKKKIENFGCCTRRIGEIFEEEKKLVERRNAMHDTWEPRPDLLMPVRPAPQVPVKAAAPVPFTVATPVPAPPTEFAPSPNTFLPQSMKILDEEKVNNRMYTESMIRDILVILQKTEQKDETLIQQIKNTLQAIRRLPYDDLREKKIMFATQRIINKIPRYSVQVQELLKVKGEIKWKTEAESKIIIDEQREKQKSDILAILTRMSEEERKIYRHLKETGQDTTAYINQYRT